MGSRAGNMAQRVRALTRYRIPRMHLKVSTGGVETGRSWFSELFSQGNEAGPGRGRAWCHPVPQNVPTTTRMQHTLKVKWGGHIDPGAACVNYGWAVCASSDPRLSGLFQLSASDRTIYPTKHNSRKHDDLPLNKR